MLLPESTTLPLDQITPYWRNPRRISDDAVNKVAESISRYGYQQPIVVDREHVIIVGHTRLLALQKLGWTQAQVYVSDLPDEKAKEYRLVDNKTSEMTTWDHNALVLELREWEAELLETFFPEMNLEIEQVSASTQVTDEDLRNAEDRITQVSQADALTVHTTEVVCPACFHTFQVRTKSLPGLTWEDLQDVVAGEQTERSAG